MKTLSFGYLCCAAFVLLTTAVLLDVPFSSVHGVLMLLSLPAVILTDGLFNAFILNSKRRREIIKDSLVKVSAN